MRSRSTADPAPKSILGVDHVADALGEPGIGHPEVDEPWSRSLGALGRPALDGFGGELQATSRGGRFCRPASFSATLVA